MGDQPRPGTRQGQVANAACPAILREYNVRKDNATKAETQEIKDEPASGLCGIDGIGGHAKPDQHGRSICGLGDSSARASGRKALLSRALSPPFRQVTIWAI